MLKLGMKDAEKEAWEVYELHQKENVSLKEADLLRDRIENEKAFEYFINSDIEPIKPYPDPILERIILSGPIINFPNYFSLRVKRINEVNTIFSLEFVLKILDIFLKNHPNENETFMERHQKIESLYFNLDNHFFPFLDDCYAAFEKRLKKELDNANNEEKLDKFSWHCTEIAKNIITFRSFSKLEKFNNFLEKGLDLVHNYRASAVEREKILKKELLNIQQDF